MLANNEVVKALKNGTNEVREIIVKYKNGKEKNNTTNVFWHIVASGEADYIYDRKTGIMLFTR